MSKQWLILLLLFSLSLALSAQQDCGTDCDCILKKADELATVDSQNPDFQNALKLYEAARLCYRNAGEEKKASNIESRIVDMFNNLNALKNKEQAVSQELKKAQKDIEESYDSLTLAQQKLEETYAQLKAQRDSISTAQTALEEEKKEVSKQYLIGEIRRLDYIINQLLSEKKHSIALGLWQYREQEIVPQLQKMLGDAQLMGMDKENFQQNFQQDAAYAVLQSSNDFLSLAKDSLLQEYLTPAGIYIQVYPDKILYYQGDNSRQYPSPERIERAAISSNGKKLIVYNRRGYRLYSIHSSDTGLKDERAAAIVGLKGIFFSADRSNPEDLVILDGKKFYLEKDSSIIYEYPSNWENISVEAYPHVPFKVKGRAGSSFLVDYQFAPSTDSIFTRLIVVAPPKRKNSIRQVKSTSYNHHKAGLTIAPNGKFVIGYDTDNRIKYLDENGLRLAFFQALPEYMPPALLEVGPYHKKGQSLLTLRTDNSLWAWNLKGQPLFKQEQQFSALQQLHFMPNEPLIISIDIDKVQLWALDGRLISQTEHLYELGYGNIYQSAFNPETNEIYLLTNKGYLLNYSLYKNEVDSWPPPHNLLNKKEKDAYELSTK